MALGSLVLLLGGISAWRWRWTSDDAFISFRYARNLIEGHGLVFNVGERVEGYSNFLWTLWCALGLQLGVSAENWANLGSIACYLLTLTLLLARFRLLRRHAPGWWLPPAALGAALHRDWAIYATGGLETALFVLLLVAAALVVASTPAASGRYALAGLLAGLAALTRPDGMLPAAILGLYVLAFAPSRVRASLVYVSVVATLVLPFLGWRYLYYGDWVPNTYYAKSAGESWFEQGWHYAALYARKYWILVLGPVLFVAVRGMAARAGDSSTEESGARREGLLFAALAMSYGLFVVKVGGDFMFARMLLPVTPFLFLLLEDGLLRGFRQRPLVGQALLAALLIGMVLTPVPVDAENWKHGIADERAYYSGRRLEVLDHAADVLGRAFDGLPVRVAFYGDEARIVYKARFPVAIESHAGLTDAYVARQPLPRRGRIGHEKHAPLDYLIDRRKVHFTFSEMPQKLLPLRESIPEVIVPFDNEVYGQLLHWDPELMAALRARGIPVPDFLGALDGYLARIDDAPLDHVRANYDKLHRFYFDHVSDPRREAPFLRRLGRPDPSVATD